MDDNEPQDAPATPPASSDAPTSFDQDARGWAVVDAATGDAIEQVIAADTAAGTVTRFNVQDGNLVRIGDAFSIVSETRPIRIIADEATA